MRQDRPPGRARCRVLIMFFAASACASPPKPPPRPTYTRAPSPLPRSSIVAVLTHRAELSLDDDQVKRFEQVQSDLDKKDAEIRQGSSAGTGGQASASDGAQQVGEGHQRGRGTGSGHSRSRGASKRNQGPTGSDVERALDDQDTAAFLEAEEILRADQRERAREIAEKYREDLYAQKEQAKQPPAPSP